MPKEGLNIYLTATDSMSPALSSITDKTKALDKETQQLQQTYTALQKANSTLIQKKTELQKKLQEVNEEVKEARKNFKTLGDEASSDAYEEAQKKQEALRNSIAATNKALRENEKAYKENIETIRKGEAEGVGTSLKDMAKGIFAGQIGQMFSSSLGGLGQSFLTSMIGTPEASLISDTLSNAISGGAAGAMFGPWGIAAGATLGGVSGLISGGTKIWEAQDDAFKSYYGGLYDEVKGRSGETVSAGSAIAGGREQTRMAFAQRLGGDQEARDYLAQVEKMAANTNYEYDEIVGYAKLLLNSYDPEEVFGVLRDLSDATAGLNLSSGDVNMMISGLSRMRTTGKATQEYLNYFRERGVGTDQALAGALGVEKSSVADLVRDGKVGGELAAQAILDYIQEQYTREVLDAVLKGTHGELWESFDESQQNTLSELNREYAAAMARYDASKGEDGIGTDAQAGAELEKLYETAQTLGQSYFDNSEFMQMLNDTELSEVEAIRENTAGLDEATQAAYRLSQELSKGLGSTITVQEDVKQNVLDGFTMSSLALSGNMDAAMSMLTKSSHAFGLDRVPYDDYPALLHQGERVLTASQARAQDAGQAGGVPVQITVTGNSFTGTPEEMADQLAEQLGGAEGARRDRSATIDAPRRGVTNKKRRVAPASGQAVLLLVLCQSDFVQQLHDLLFRVVLLLAAAENQAQIVQQRLLRILAFFFGSHI